MTRTETITQKIDGAAIGLRGSIFVHVDHNGAGSVEGVRISTKAKEDDSTLDKLAHAIGDALTAIIADVRRAA